MTLLSPILYRIGVHQSGPTSIRVFAVTSLPVAYWSRTMVFDEMHRAGKLNRSGLPNCGRGRIPGRTTSRCSCNVRAMEPRDET